VQKLPFRAATAAGDVFDFEFPLHRETADPVRVGQLVSAILEAVDRDIGLIGETSNGDVLQAVAMALAIRARMIHAPQRTTETLTAELLASALHAAAEARRESPQSGHA
jgi:hypothetical protein